MLDLNKARAKMEEEGLDALIALDLLNVYYSTGHWSEFCYLVKEHIRPVVMPKDSEPFIICPDFEINDFAEHSQFKNFVPYPTEVYVRFQPGPSDHYAEGKKRIEAIDLSPLESAGLHQRLVRMPILVLAKELKDRGLDKATLGIDDWRAVPYATWLELEKALPYATLKNAGKIFLDLRMIKSPRELDYISKAAKMTEELFDVVGSMAIPGGKHSDIVTAIAKGSTTAYSDRFEMSVDLIGAPATAFTDHILQKGECLLCDIGAMYQHYLADVSRNFAIGEPSAELRKIHDATVEAQEAILSKIGPGADPGELHAIGMSIMKKADPNYRRGHLGHNLGLEGHETPYIAPNQEFSIQPGMAMAIEIPYYYAGVWGVNMEDTIFITEDGYKYASGAPPSKELRVAK